MDKATPTKILVLGGGFAGVYSAVYLDKLCKNDPSIEVTLISQTNYFLMTPLLFEAGSGVLEPRHSVNPIRQMFSQARFIQGRVESIDIAMHEVGVRLAHDRIRQVSFDHLVLALGGVTNTKLIAGSEHALQFKTLADAIFLRNHTIQRFERADVEDDAQERAGN